jgi:hypothetical protein
VNPEEVIVGTVRRRRRSPPKPDTPPPPNVRNWVVYLALTTLLAALMFNGYLTDRPANPPLPALSQAADVRSTIAEAADSLQIVVGWDLTLSDPEGVPDSVRVRVILEAADTLILTQPSSALADTAHLPAPKAGQRVAGISCVAAQHGETQLVEEVCTPWQYVRPFASSVPPTPTPTSSAAAAVGIQIVIQPRGLQVDPDIGGRCAEWQRTHPPDSVWIEVNRTAVPECTGPNRKPTVAQFCAFAVMQDGRRLKTRNSTNNRYCEELFAEWIRERYS